MALLFLIPALGVLPWAARSLLRRRRRAALRLRLGALPAPDFAIQVGLSRGYSLRIPSHGSLLCARVRPGRGVETEQSEMARLFFSETEHARALERLFRSGAGWLELGPAGVVIGWSTLPNPDDLNEGLAAVAPLLRTLPEARGPAIAPASNALFRPRHWRAIGALATAGAVLGWEELRRTLTPGTFFLASARHLALAFAALACGAWLLSRRNALPLPRVASLLVVTAALTFLLFPLELLLNRCLDRGTERTEPATVTRKVGTGRPLLHIRPGWLGFPWKESVSTEPPAVAAKK